MSLYLRELGIEHERVFMDTGWEHPLTYDFVRGPLTKALGPITEIRGDLDFVGLVTKKGLFPSRVTRFCTTELKVFPIQRYLERAAEAGPVVNAVGIRRAESRARSRMHEWEWSDTFDCDMWRPLVAWSADDVLAIHQRHGLALNPLYGMGASRVGCWPCIHARKAEIALVDRIDPERIDLIERLERDLNQAAQERHGTVEIPRTMFNYHGGDSRHHPINIREAVAWGNSKRGEWQPPGAGEGCMRFGLCEVAEEVA